MGQAHGIHSGHICCYEPEVRADFPDLAPQWPPPAPVPCWSPRDKGGPQLHLHGSLLLLLTEAPACVSTYVISALGPH